MYSSGMDKVACSRERRLHAEGAKGGKSPVFAESVTREQLDPNCKKCMFDEVWHGSLTL